ncbi:unnamed protein product [Trifolium pratense]|uniref:Uncharacterized protein n=1 Tax=Trifolium pratense TaxID=57577 RepID=A0ACB0K473_TRIPR|nr:unnamed protein product [Trifolium pratense]
MAEGPQNRPLKSYAIPSQAEPHNSIAAPAIEANNFELKPSLLSAVQQNQFSGNPTDDPNLHLSIFLQYADTVKANGVSPEAIRLRLFPFSLRDKARAWLQSLPSNSVATWDELKKVFLARYFPPSKTAMLRAQINGFRQRDNESLFEAWERYKEMIRICPHHGLEEWLIIHTFYNGLLYNTRLTIDAAAGGALMDKAYNEAYRLIESMAQNHYQWGSERAPVEKTQTKGGMYEISNMDHINAKLDALTQKIETLTTAPKATVAASTQNCELCGVQGHAIAECQLLTEVSPDQVNYTQGNPYNHGPRNHPYLSYKSNNALYAPGQAPTPSPPGFQKPAQNVPRKSNLELLMENFITTQAQTNLQTSEQIKQITSKLDALTTHNKMLETQIAQVAQQQASTSAPAGTFPGQPQQNPRGQANAVILRSGKQLDKPTKSKPDDPAVQQDILTNKRKIEDDETVMLTAECSAILQNEMPPKLKDPGSFSIPCVIGKYVIDRALCDLGASISLMPVALCEKLKMGELRPTKMSVQFADRSVKYPLGILENVPVRVGQFFIPTDFIVMDIREDSNTPILLGRPFLATAGAIIDRQRFEDLFEREMSFQNFPHQSTMISLGIAESVNFMINQLGWDALNLSTLPTYRNLTIEFLSSFKNSPNRGFSIHRGQTKFRLFGADYTYTHRSIAEFMKVPTGLDAVVKTQEDGFMDYELCNFWGSISGEPNSDPADRTNQKIHNPAIRYFHMILAHTIFGKQENDTTVSKDELFIMFCAFQGRPVNLAPFVLANLQKLVETPNRRICIGGFVTLLARAIGLDDSLGQLIPYGTPLASGFRYLNINFCFNRGLIHNLGPTPYTLVINNKPVYHFTLPNMERTSVYNKANWLYDLEDEDEHDPQTPPFYYTPGPLSPAHPAESTNQPPAPVDHTAAIAEINATVATLRSDLNTFLDLTIGQFERCAKEFASIHDALKALRG